jgi:hypothetical protein
VSRTTSLLLGGVLLLAACGRKSAPVAPELVRPGVAENLTAIATPEGVRLTWLRPERYSGGQRMNDLAGFLIERAPGEGPAAFAPVHTLELEDQERFRRERRLEWTDPMVRPGERYLYRVIALTLDGDRSAPSGPVAVRFGPTTTESP